MHNDFYVDILTNYTNNVLYIGYTDDLERKVYEHKNKVYPKSFTARYNVHKLVYFEEYPCAIAAKDRETQLKAGSRQKKIDLIESVNLEWIDLYEELFGE
ncbi:MAG TPA: endonuclease [Microscillaceae bacterium]|nr:endonuclease [Microscillaceae bacterium]